MKLKFILKTISCKIGNIIKTGKYYFGLKNGHALSNLTFKVLGCGSSLRGAGDALAPGVGLLSGAARGSSFRRSKGARQCLTPPVVEVHVRCMYLIEIHRRADGAKREITAHLKKGGDKYVVLGVSCRSRRMAGGGGNYSCPCHYKPGCFYGGRLRAVALGRGCASCDTATKRRPRRQGR